MKPARDPGSAPRVFRIAAYVLLLSIVLCIGFAVAGASSATFSATTIYRVLMGLSVVMFVGSAAVTSEVQSTVSFVDLMHPY